MEKTPVDWVSLTLALLLHVQLFFIAMWDIWVWASNSDGQTVSAVVWKWAQAFPVGLLFFGIVLGHIFWPLKIGKGN